MMPVRAIEFYSGIGGLHKALETSSVSGSVVRAFDWNEAAFRVYQANYGKAIVQKADISKLTSAEIVGLDARLWLLSPSCQPYTVLNPEAKGEADPRAKSFIHLIDDVLPELFNMKQHPSHMLVENVAGFETSSTRQNLLRTLHNLNYTTVELLLTPLQFGIPNSRLRYYLLAKSDRQPFPHVPKDPTRVWRHIPGKGEDWEDPRTQADDSAHNIGQISYYLDKDLTEDEFRQYAVPDRVLEKWGRLFNIVLPSWRRTCCFTRGYTRLTEGAGSVLQLNEALDTTAVFDEFAAKQRAGDPDAVRVLDPLRLRYFTPNELLCIFCFEPPSFEGKRQSFVWPEVVSIKSRYKLMGNSVNVRVVRELIEYLFED